jgi:hypothetical protein
MRHTSSLRLSNCASNALVVDAALIQLRHYSLGILCPDFSSSTSQSRLSGWNVIYHVYQLMNRSNNLVLRFVMYTGV